MSLDRLHWKNQWTLSSFLAPPSPCAKKLTHCIIPHQIQTTLKIPILQKREWSLWNGTQGYLWSPSKKGGMLSLGRKGASKGQLLTLSTLQLGEAGDLERSLGNEWIWETIQSWDSQTVSSDLGSSTWQSGSTHKWNERCLQAAHIPVITTEVAPDWHFPDGETEDQRGCLDCFRSHGLPAVKGGDF